VVLVSRNSLGAGWNLYLSVHLVPFGFICVQNESDTLRGKALDDVICNSAEPRFNLGNIV